MTSSKRLPVFLVIVYFFCILISTEAAPRNQLLFREYLGAENKSVRFDDVPINSNVDFHFILSFAIDYTTSFTSPAPTNGDFNIFWDKKNLSPSEIASIKAKHTNVKVALSLGGDSVANGTSVYFKPSSIESWLHNAVISLTKIIAEYNIDGIDIDYEHFTTGEDPGIFTECIGRLIIILKQRKVIKFASIAPYDDDRVQSHYQPLWKKYGHAIDYVNFQFYAYDKGTTVFEFLEYFMIQSSNYEGGKMLVSFGTDNSGGLKPKNGFFTACRKLKSQGKLQGIFIWSADDSKDSGFPYERQSQGLLAA